MFVEPKHKLFYLLGIIPGGLLVWFFTSYQMDSRGEVAAWAKQPVEEWPQLVLSNEVRFKERSGISGYCSCLVDLDGRLVGVTSIHFLERASLDVGELDGALDQWLMFPANAPSDSIRVRGLHREPAAYRRQHFACLFLDLDPPIDAWPAESLSIRRGMPPRPGATVYVIANPSGWSPNGQTIHEARVVDCQMGIMRGRTVADVRLGKAIGAPVVNPLGQLEGILVSERGDATGEPGGFIAHSLLVVLKKMR